MICFERDTVQSRYDDMMDWGACEVYILKCEKKNMEIDF